jgi:hypothetical protein
MVLSPILNFLIGLAVLLFGRKLFWLFVAVAGFVLGVVIAPLLLPNQPDWLIVLVALGLGVVGAILAIVVQQVAVAVAGFIFGGYALLALLGAIGLNVTPWDWLAYIIGGIIGAVLVIYLFDPALIGLSAIVGAILITNVVKFTNIVPLNPPFDLALIVILAVVGIAFQAETLRRQPPEERQTRRGNRS